MEVWITGYYGFLHEAIGLFVADSSEAETLLPVSGSKLPFSELS